ncbi:hypothetical protein AKJ16_DCAP03908 [Drosera capensis]
MLPSPSRLGSRVAGRRGDGQLSIFPMSGARGQSRAMNRPTLATRKNPVPEAAIDVMLLRAGVELRRQYEDPLSVTRLKPRHGNVASLMKKPRGLQHYKHCYSFHHGPNHLGRHSPLALSLLSQQSSSLPQATLVGQF